MKKLSVILAAGALCASLLCGCGGDTEDAKQASDDGAATAAASDDGAAAVDTQAVAGYSYSLNGVTLTPNAEWAPSLDQLGDADSYFESDSCAFQGKDKVYTYGSVNITTYPMDDVDYINIIELKDDTVSTAEGICIGSSKDDVIAAYGDATSETESSLTYSDGNCELSFMFDNDAVSAITYTAITE